MAHFRRFWAGLLLAVVGTTAVLAETTLRRTTLLVHDVEKSIAFYSTLGLRPYYDARRTLQQDGAVIGADDLPLAGEPADSRIVILIGPNQDTGMIGLLSYKDPPLANVRTQTEGQGRGDVILMFNVDDIHGLYRQLNVMGSRFHLKPYRYEVKDNDGGIRSTGWRMFVYDPDGRLVEIAQPDRKRHTNANIDRWAEGVIAYRVKSSGHINGYEHWRLDVHPDGSKSMAATVRYDPRPVTRHVYHRASSTGDPLDTFASYWIDGQWRGNAWFIMDKHQWRGEILSASGDQHHIVEPGERFAMVPHVLAVDSWRTRLFDKAAGGTQKILGYNMDAMALGPQSLKGKLMHYNIEYIGERRISVPAGEFETELFRIEGVVDLYLFGPDSLVAKFVYEAIDREHVLVEYRASPLPPKSVSSDIKVRQ